MDPYKKLHEKFKKARSLLEITKLLNVVKKLTIKPLEAIEDLQESTSSSHTSNIVRMRSRITMSDDSIHIDRDGDGLGPIGKDVRKFSRPDMAELVKNFKPIHEIMSIMSVLETAEAVTANTVIPNSPGSTRAQAQTVLREAKQLRNMLESAFRDGFRALNAMARKHHPAEMVNLAEKVEKAVKEVIEEDSYQELSSEFYVTPDPNPSVLKIYYTYYIKVEGLNDAMGYEYPDFNIVVTGVLEGGYEEDVQDRNNKIIRPSKSPGRISYYVTSLSEFRPPSSFPFGRPLPPGSPQAAINTAVSRLITASGLMSKLHLYPFVLSDDDIRKYGLSNVQGVQNIESKDDAVYVTIKPGLNNTDEFLIVRNVIFKIKPILDTITEGYRKKNTSIRFKYLNDGNSPVIKFVIAKDTGGKDDGSLNTEILDEIIEKYGLSTDQANHLRRQIRTMYHV